ncbi:NitT/TauT family transport system substrate-binding protein [Rhodobacter viridis]|uniref:NitT/TauT family transport system substrate-binding protein n=1 Tax=Rhodobacter viridis TaxID=1054202 RepID=A0A318UGH1_9RHOB|nr:ABC transporter substrate-binding protein [Rhodobacter viridis]PYF12655.1 NitT/TauT family transport system substrate-binding protein [Rhodobacter viridis]
MPQTPSPSRLSRRSLIKGAAVTVVASGALAAGGARLFTPAIAGPAPKVRLAWTEVAACHSPLGFGVAKGFFAKQGVDVELFNQGASGQTLIQALATGKADIGSGLTFEWLKPLEQGFDVKLFAGTHGGCTRLLATEASGVSDLQGLRGKTIVSYDVASPPKQSFQVTLAKAGLDPERDVNWIVAPFDLLGEVAARGEADAVAQLDPWAWSLQKQHKFKLIADTQTGVFQDAVCCVLGANGPFLEQNRDTLQRVAAANIEIHEYAAAHPEEVAAWYKEALNPAGLSTEDLAEILAGFVLHNHPVGEPLVREIARASSDLKLIKVIDEGTDPEEFARRITVNLLG